MQLTGNAVDHTADGGLISVGSAVRDGRVLLWVSDDGPGVAPGERERIFERFATVGRRGRDSTGLGLAIVRSIAGAHGGVARVAENEGGGATFLLDLPLRPTGGGPAGDRAAPGGDDEGGAVGPRSATPPPTEAVVLS